MARTWKRKTATHGVFNAETMRTAVGEVLRGRSVRDVADEFGLKKSTLNRYVIAKRNNSSNIGNDSLKYRPNYDNARVFSDDQESMLAKYVIDASNMHYGLSAAESRKLAYQFADANNICVPPSWSENKRAGYEWFRAFLSRHDLSIRTPEPTSLSRSTSFNQSNVSTFFDNLQEVMDKFKFDAADIYNVDESALTTVHKPVKVVAGRGTKQVGQMTSGERGTLVTICAAVNAIGNSIPPFLVFPRVHFRDHMLKGAPTGSAGAASGSGWMTSESFVQFLHHFIKFTKCSTSSPVLLTMDNHDSHISIESLNLAKESGISLLTFPPHCSHKLQPLDRSVFGPLKRHYNAACDAWMLRNPGKPMSIYDISEVLGYSFPLAFTPVNVVAGFRVSGIFPFNRQIFSDSDFLSSFVTDRIQRTAANDEQQTMEPPSTPSSTAAATPSTTSTNDVPQLVSPVELRPHPKAADRKGQAAGRRKCKSAVLTSTPVKSQLEAEMQARRDKCNKKSLAVTERKKGHLESQEKRNMLQRKGIPRNLCMTVVPETASGSDRSHVNKSKSATHKMTRSQPATSVKPNVSLKSRHGRTPQCSTVSSRSRKPPVFSCRPPPPRKPTWLLGMHRISIAN